MPQVRTEAAKKSSYYNGCIIILVFSILHLLTLVFRSFNNVVILTDFYCLHISCKAEFYILYTQGSR